MGAIISALGRLSLLQRVLIPAVLAFLTVYPLSVYFSSQAQMEFYQSAIADETLLILDTLEKQTGEQVVIGDYTVINAILQDRVKRGLFRRIDFTDYEGLTLVAQRQEPLSLSPAWFNKWLHLPEQPITRKVTIGGRLYGTITVALSHVEFQNKIWKSVVNQTGLALLGVLAFFASVSLILKYSLMPLRNVHEVAHQAASGDVSARALATYEGYAPEIREAVRMFNEAAATIDIHLRKRIEALLLMLNEHRKAIDSSAIVSEYDRHGDIIHVNDRFCEVSGYSKAELVEKTFQLRCLAASSQNAPTLEEVMRSGQTWNGELKIVNKHGQNYWVESTINPILDGEGNIEKFISIDMDITERKNQHDKLEKAYTDLKSAQSQILQQEKMASIGQLAAGVAHEINNPTGYILSNLNSLRKYSLNLTAFVNLQTEAIEKLAARGGEEIKAVYQSSAEQRKKLKIDYIMADIGQLIDESLEGGQRVKQIVQNLRSFSRIDATEYKPSDINRGIENTLAIVWNELKYKATVIKEYGDIPCIRCNIGQLNQVFLNILVNASHAIETQGEVTVKTWADENNIMVSIADTGCGIPADQITRIFEPFFTTKDVGKGTGLGLSIAYDIIKTHNGQIAVTSEMGNGTTFTITIPIVV